MQQRLLGRTGVQVSTLALGTMSFGAWGNPDHADAIRIIHRALDAGITFIDTADVYSAGESEQILGKALTGSRRDGVVLTTKFHEPMGEGPNQGGASRRWIVREVEASLKRLDTDYIDLYLLHRPRPDTDITETLSALDELIRQGKILYTGSSAFTASQIVDAQWAAAEQRLHRFVVEQPTYSIVNRTIEADVLPATTRHRMGVMVYSPLAGGWLSGRWRKNQPLPTSSRGQGALAARYDMSLPENQRKLDIVDQLAHLAEANGMTLIELAIAWVLNHPAVTSAIIGPRSMEHLESQLTAADTVIPIEMLDQIDRLVAPGSVINPADAGYAIPTADQRRRPTGTER